jgi:hypothetical protein
MKKVCTEAVRQSRNMSYPKLTIGLDLENVTVPSVLVFPQAHPLRRTQRMRHPNIVGS